MLEVINFTSNVCLCVSINDSVNVFTLDLSQVTYVSYCYIHSVVIHCCHELRAQYFYSWTTMDLFCGEVGGSARSYAEMLQNPQQTNYSFSSNCSYIKKLVFNTANYGRRKN